MQSPKSVEFVGRHISLSRMIAAAVILLPLIGTAAELSDEERALGKERRDAVIAQAASRRCQTA
jgi:hypothetical protein